MSASSGLVTSGQLAGRGPVFSTDPFYLLSPEISLRAIITNFNSVIDRIGFRSILPIN